MLRSVNSGRRNEIEHDAKPIDFLVRSAQRLLAREHGASIRLSDPIVLARRDRSLTLRCAVTGWDGVASVVIKRNDGDDERGFSDWASLQFLTMVGGDIAPRFYAGDDEARFLVMQDLGVPRSLEHVFSQQDETSAVNALRSLAGTMARLIVVTIGRESDYRSLRRALPEADGLGRQREAERWLEALGRVRTWAKEVDVALPTGFDRACDDVANIFAEPGAWLAFSHGDPAPSNNHFSGERSRLVDFEYADYRHGLYDFSAWDTLCPIPEPWLREMQDAFRDVLRSRLHEELPLTETDFRQSWGAMCAYRALAIMSWMPLDLLNADRPWADSWSSRAALLTALQRLHISTTGLAGLEPLAVFGGGLHRALFERWPEAGDNGPNWLSIRLGTG